MRSFPESSFTDCPIFRSDYALFLFYTTLFFLVLVTYFHRMYFPMNEKTRKHMLPGLLSILFYYLESSVLYT